LTLLGRAKGEDINPINRLQTTNGTIEIISFFDMLGFYLGKSD
jgi:hypothetical protein